MSLPLFVYGTLMEGQPQAALLGALGRVKATTTGALYRLPAGYPALKVAPEGTVHGELVDPPEARLLDLLDHYEGVDQGLFQRVQVDVTVGLKRRRAWCYAMPSPRLKGGVPLASGRWSGVIRR